MYVSIFWTIKYEKNSCLNWMISFQKCYHILNWFFLPKPDCLEFISNFSNRNHLKINISHILNPNLTKQIPWNPAHQGSFQQDQRHIPIPLNKFSVKKSFNIQELLHHESKHHGTKAHARVLSESFPQRTQSKASWFGGSHNYNTKQNKTNYLPSFTDRSSNNKKIPPLSSGM